MSERSAWISSLINNRNSRASYLRAKLAVNISSQIRALRLRQGFTQVQFAPIADMRQSRISAMEQPGKTQFSIETLIKLAAAYKVGLQVRFVPFSQVLRWDNEYSQDTFNVRQIDTDRAFLNPHSDAQSALDDSTSTNSAIPRGQLKLDFEDKASVGGPDSPAGRNFQINDNTGRKQERVWMPKDPSPTTLIFQ